MKDKRRDRAGYALSRLALNADGALCAPGSIEHLVDKHSDGAYAVLRFFVQCAGAVETLEISL